MGDENAANSFILTSDKPENDGSCGSGGSGRHGGIDLSANNFILTSDKPENEGGSGRHGGDGGGIDLSARQMEGEGRDIDLERSMSFTKTYQSPQPREKEYSSWETLVLAYQSLGVVYGDLGTSPVNVFSATSLTNLTEDDLLGTLSLIIWTLTFLVLIKYVFIVLHANDHGEGGTFALYSYICRHINIRSKFTIQNTSLESDSNMAYYTGGGSQFSTRAKEFLERSSSSQNFLIVVVLLGTCMVIGDGALTPATCVLSALQGIQSCSSKISQDHVVWISVVILVGLFMFQRCGTSKVGFLFSPIMLVWFATNVSIGVYNIINYHPSILKAVSPHYIINFFMVNSKTAWDLLGAVFLGTGAEAMFADLGHFNKRAIQLGFSLVVYPSLIITYAGEAAYLIKYPQNITNAYYSSVPNPVYWPMFVISILAAIVSSQSMISASFSIIKQSLALGCFPRVDIIHTSSKHQGQVYSPEINYILMILTVALVIGFKGGVELANAYGVVVIWVMIITTFLTSLIMLVIWKTNIIFVLVFLLPYVLMEGAFMTSLLKKIPQGGWVPFAISVLFMAVMLSWTYGRSNKTTYEAKNKMSIRELDDALSGSNVCRTPGVCFFFTDLVYGIPPILRRYIQHTNSVREIMVVITIRTLPMEDVAPDKRLIVGKLGCEGVYRCLIQFGYKEAEDINGDEYVDSIVAKLLEVTDDMIERRKIESAVQRGVTFVTGRTILKAGKKRGMIARFTIDYLYRFLQKNSKPAFSAFRMPSEATLQVGMLYEI